MAEDQQPVAAQMNDVDPDHHAQRRHRVAQAAKDAAQNQHQKQRGNAEQGEAEVADAQVGGMGIDVHPADDQ